MNKICIIIKSLEVGGTEKALINMLNEMENIDYNVDLFLLENKVDLIDELPNWVSTKVINEFNDIQKEVYGVPYKVIGKLFKELNLFRGFHLLLIYLFSKLTNDRGVYHKYFLKYLPSLLNNYDIAIAYSGPFDFISSFVLKKIEARKKIQWIHFDVSNINFDINYARKYYNKFNQIIVVSKSSKQQLLKKIPELYNKIKVIPNMINVRYCIEQAKLYNPYLDSLEKFKILTVGRLSPEKGQLIIPKIVMQLLKLSQKNFKWYIVGDGVDFKELNNIVNKNNLQKYIVLTGKEKNPYPYFKDCDLYVQTSLHEGFCITVAEALFFNKYIISTNITGVIDQIDQIEKGILVNYDVQEFTNVIKNILEVGYEN